MSHHRSRLTGAALATLVAASMTGGVLAAAPADAAAPSARTSAAHASARAAGADSVRYACTGPLGLARVDVAIDVANLEDGDPTGMLLANGLSIDLRLDLPTGLFSGLFGGLFGGLGGLGGLGGGLGSGDDLLGQVDDFSLLFGDDELGLGEVVDQVDSPADDPRFDTRARTGRFQLPAPGEYDLALPESFSFSPLSFLGLDLFSIECTMGAHEDPVVDEVEVDEQESETDVDTTTGTDDGPVVETDVTRELGGDAAGRIVATVDRTVVARGVLRRGRAALALRHLRPGRHQVVVTYLGNRTTQPSRAVTRVVVPR